MTNRAITVAHAGSRLHRHNLHVPCRDHAMAHAMEYPFQVACPCIPAKGSRVAAQDAAPSEDGYVLVNAPLLIL